MLKSFLFKLWLYISLVCRAVILGDTGGHLFHSSELDEYFSERPWISSVEMGCNVGTLERLYGRLRDWRVGWKVMSFCRQKSVVKRRRSWSDNSSSEGYSSPLSRQSYCGGGSQYARGLRGTSISCMVSWLIALIEQKQSVESRLFQLQQQPSVPRSLAIVINRATH